MGILAYLSFGQEAHLKIALKEMIETSLFRNSTNAQPQLSTIPYLLQLSSKSDVLLQPIVSVFLELCKCPMEAKMDTDASAYTISISTDDESIIPTLCQQSKLWPSNFNINEILPSLSNLAIKLRHYATKIILTIAKIAETYVWCQDLLEFILQEIEFYFYDDRVCPLTNDIVKDSSRRLVLDACVNGTLMEQQTAVRLILLVTRQSPYIYHQSVAELLACSYTATNNNGLGALIRLLPGIQGCPEWVQLTPGIEIALEWILIQDLKNEPAHIERNLNVLKNLVTLVR